MSTDQKEMSHVEVARPAQPPPKRAFRASERRAQLKILSTDELIGLAANAYYRPEAVEFVNEMPDERREALEEDILLHEIATGIVRGAHFLVLTMRVFPDMEENSFVSRDWIGADDLEDAEQEAEARELRSLTNTAEKPVTRFEEAEEVLGLLVSQEVLAKEDIVCSWPHTRWSDRLAE